MTLDIASDPQLNLVDVRFEGVVELSGIHSAFKSLIGQPDWEPGKSIIFDYSALDFSSFSSKDMRLVSDMVVRHKNDFGSAKWAIIISGDLQFGLMRMWEIITEDRVPMSINLFKNRSDAKKWVSDKN